MAKKYEFVRCLCKDVAKRGGLNCICESRNKKLKFTTKNLYVEKK